MYNTQLCRSKSEKNTALPFTKQISDFFSVRNPLHSQKNKAVGVKLKPQNEFYLLKYIYFAKYCLRCEWNGKYTETEWIHKILV